uniref:EamA domain-containing protein n=1 Tax=Plectus sambesii TaxID=2011161 RepID=A0A914WB62_9BILA
MFLDPNTRHGICRRQGLFEQCRHPPYSTMSSSAIGAGCFACLGSVFAKLTFGDSSLSHSLDGAGWYALKIATLAAFIFCNVQMWALHAKALRLCGSTLQAVVLNTAANFVLTGICGRLLFGENHDIVWWSGIGLIILGTLLVSTAQSQNAPEEKSEKVE